MSEQDIKWLQFINSALREKYRHPDLTNYGDYYFEPTIFRWTKETFQSIQNTFGLDLKEYLEVNNRPVLERLVENLGRDSRLNFLNNPQSLTGQGSELGEDFHQKISREQLTEPKASQEVPPRPTPTQPPAPHIPPQRSMPEMPPLPPTPPEGEQKAGEGEKKEGEQMPRAPQTPKGRGIRIPKIPQGVKSAAQGATSNASIVFKKTTSRAVTAASKGIGAAIGRGGRAALGATNFGVNFGLNFSNEFSRLRVGNLSKRWLILGLLLLLLIGVLMFLSPAAPPPLPPGFVDVSQCLFTRSDQTPAQAKYQSPLLLSYIKEAYNLTGMHEMVLAAFMRVESPTLTSYTDEQVRNYVCAESPTGALGVMQLQPAGTTGHCAECVANGARLLGIAYENLTREDYCDVRKSIIMGAGWILKKMSFLGYGDGTRWDPAWTDDKDAIYALVNGYYGCILYPSCTSGPYSYGDDVWKSIQACTSTVGEIPKEKLGKIVYWSQQISDALERGSCDLDYNRMVATITDGLYTAVTRTGEVCGGTGPDGWYWCTNLIIDSYNLSGVVGLNLNHQGVKNMLSFWQSDPNYSTIPYDINSGMSSLTQIKPGFTIFMISTGGSISDHADIIVDVNIDIRGDGFITTIDSNTPRKRWQLFVSSWQITQIPGFAPIWGFGGIK